MKKTFFLLSLFLLLVFVVFACKNVERSIAGELYKSSEVKMSEVTEVRASHILVNTKDEAEKIRQEILGGQDFSKEAEEYSKCPSGKRGGDLGFFEKGMMVPAFEQAAFSLPVGQVSEPVQTQFGWHLIIVTDKR